MKHQALKFLLLIAMLVVPFLVLQGRQAVLAGGAGITFDPTTTTLNPGDSVVGDSKLMCGLVIGTSGGNDVNYIKEGQAPPAYGGNNAVSKNACMPSGWAIADVTLPNVPNRKDQYDFTFVNGSTVNSFMIRMLDWGDLLPYGACPNDICSLTLTGYDSANNVVATQVKSFTTSDTSVNGRQSLEYGDLSHSGDACEATVGQPGNFVLSLTGTGISHITLQFDNLPSMDPNNALTDISYTFESGNTGDVECQGGVAPSPTPSPSPEVSPSPSTEPSPTPEVSPSPAVTPQPSSTPEPGKQSSLGFNVGTCTDKEIEVTFDVNENNQPKENVQVSFVYNGSTKTATSDKNGRARVFFTKFGNNPVYATASDGYPSQSAYITLPDNCANVDPGVNKTGQVLGATTVANPAAHQKAAQVLGATSLANTGTADEKLATMALLSGILVTGLAITGFATANKRS